MSSLEGPQKSFKDMQKYERYKVYQPRLKLIVFSANSIFFLRQCFPFHNKNHFKRHNLPFKKNNNCHEKLSISVKQNPTRNLKRQVLVQVNNPSIKVGSEMGRVGRGRGR